MNKKFLLFVCTLLVVSLNPKIAHAVGNFMSNLSVDRKITRNYGTPGNTSPWNTSPGNTSPWNTTPSNASPNDATPSDATPGNASPSDATPSVADVSVYVNCSNNGYNMGIAEVLGSSGRNYCGYVQLWAGGPKWATFNVGATITDYATLTVGANSTSFSNYTDQAPYYNTANVGGLYAYKNPDLNGRKTTWDSSVSTGISDVATSLWGSNWKTPTKAQLDTLQNSTYGKTTWTWCDGSTTQYVAGCTLKGYKVSGVGDYANYSIFLPVAGFFVYDDGMIYNASDVGYYWAHVESGSRYYLHFDSSNHYIGYGGRGNGRSVRSVLTETVSIESPKDVTLILYANGCEKANTITCPEGQQMRINAVETYGFHFVQWTDGNTTNPRVITMNSNATYTAQFAKNLYTITTAANDSVRGVVKGDTTVEYLETVWISATENYGYHFTTWNDGNTSNPRQVQVTEDKTYTAQFDKNTYSVSTSKDANITSVTAGGTYYYLDEIVLSATPMLGYQFDHWSDGNTDNPRTLIVTKDTSLMAFASKIRSGKCGDNLTWRYADGVLVVSGTGAMYDYQQGTAPWMALYKDSITNVVINNGCTSIGNFAFYGLQNRAFTSLVLPKTVETIGAYAFDNCNRLTSISLPAALLEIANYAFSGCNSVNDITSLATTRPDIYENTFKDVSSYAYLYVPCDYKRSYQLNSYWSRFDLQCVGAEPSTNPVTDVTVIPTENTVTITWPTNANANTYTIEIKKDGITFCTLTFNDQGQLMNIAFAPGRGMNNQLAAEAVAGGYKFTITSLNPGTNYNYEVDTQDAAGKSIANYTGEFTTTGGTATSFDQLPNSPSDRFTKIIRDGQLFILRDSKTYNAQGGVVE